MQKSSQTVCRQAAEEASAQLRAAQQAEQSAAEKLSLQKSALSAMEADFEARTERLQAALQEAAASRSSVDALQAEVGKASTKAQAALKVSTTLGSTLWKAIRTTAFARYDQVLFVQGDTFHLCKVSGFRHEHGSKLFAQPTSSNTWSMRQHGECGKHHCKR